MKSLFVTATGTDVGKTFVACALIRALRSAGRAVNAFKPVLSGYETYEGSDAARLLEALGRPASHLDAISPWRFKAALAPPSAARLEGARIDLEALVSLCRAQTGDPLLIEGAGGVMSPIAEGATNLDLMEALGAPAVLVTGSYLGAVSHTLTALEALAIRKVPIVAVVVSESIEAPPPTEILEALAAFVPGHRIFLAKRDEAFSADPLAAAL